jgi:hypothetical protein
MLHSLVRQITMPALRTCHYEALEACDSGILMLKRVAYLILEDLRVILMIVPADERHAVSDSLCFVLIRNAHLQLSETNDLDPTTLAKGGVSQSGYTKS